MNTIAALCLLAQAGPLADYYAFELDTNWTYTRLENKAERKIVATVTKKEPAKIEIDWKDFEKDGSLKENATVTWSIVDGILTAVAKSRTDAGDDQVLTFPILKEGSKKDDTWTCEAGELTHRGTAEVTVPAGTYKNAVWTRLSLGGESSIDFYVAPKVGLVKVEIHEPGGDPNRFELAEFKPPKK